MNAKRILSLVLALVMLCSLFLVSCAKEEPKQTQQQSLIVGSDSKDANSKYDAKIKKLNGHEFRFVVRNTSASHLSVNEVYAENINGDKINDAVYARNAQLEKDYQCTIVEDRQSNPASAVREPLIAGEYVADFLLGTAMNLRSLAAANLVADLNELSSVINLNKAWWDPNGMQGMNVGGKTFFVNGDGTTLDDRAAWILFFNKDWVEEYDPELNLYDVVEKGEWTIDLMYELMVNTAKDLDNDGVMTARKDRFGYIGERFNNWVHVNGCGETLSRISSSGEYEIPAQPKAELLTIWEKLRPLLTSDKRLVDDAGSLFRSGLSTFFSCNTGTILNAASSTISLGVLPLPKLNAEQEKYYNGVSYAQLGCFAIPTTTDNCEDWETNGFSSGREQAAYFLEAFCYQSMRILTPAFYDQVILKQSIRDVESAKMVEYAMENKIYDPVVGYDFGKLLKLFYEVGSPNNEAPGSDAAYDTFVSTYESRYTAARKALQDYLNYINTEAL
ncbi:MAG: hypothetical protein E7580_00385 [Ruminococcaceae bacterium]|nr:hypothetical protein [Oscillospiraceae bacterium]